MGGREVRNTPHAGGRKRRQVFYHSGLPVLPASALANRALSSEMPSLLPVQSLSCTLLRFKDNRQNSEVALKGIHPLSLA